ncbi:hypothetical protein M422DRAFT_240211 [Sphaerobolus stellatus SS14]|nr:hypothetical protein M422DRAFT_240211 [Sphaerobolus stellatus SS14]
MPSFSGDTPPRRESFFSLGKFALGRSLSLQDKDRLFRLLPPSFVENIQANVCPPVNWAYFGAFGILVTLPLVFPLLLRFASIRLAPILDRHLRQNTRIKWAYAESRLRLSILYGRLLLSVASLRDYLHRKALKRLDTIKLDRPKNASPLDFSQIPEESSSRVLSTYNIISPRWSWSKFASVYSDRIPSCSSSSIRGLLGLPNPDPEELPRLALIRWTPNGQFSWELMKIAARNYVATANTPEIYEPSIDERNSDIGLAIPIVETKAEEEDVLVIPIVETKIEEEEVLAIPIVETMVEEEKVQPTEDIPEKLEIAEPEPESRIPDIVLPSTPEASFILSSGSSTQNDTYLEESNPAFEDEHYAPPSSTDMNDALRWSTYANESEERSPNPFADENAIAFVPFPGSDAKPQPQADDASDAYVLSDSEPLNSDSEASNRSITFGTPEIKKSSSKRRKTKLSTRLSKPFVWLAEKKHSATRSNSLSRGATQP